MAGELVISGVALRISILDNGQRTVDAADLAALFDLWVRNAGVPDADAERLVRWVNGLGDA